MWKTDWPKSPVTSDTIVVLHRILRDWCDEGGHLIGSQEGGRTAKSLINWYEFGVTDEEELARLIRDDIIIAEA
ncbi:hypothetical protein IB277_29205 [Ensifer sp. ENS07]|jgi:hypothetical protein|uniref:Uncharacterized protein n=1 Tax=Ensifer adhaerens TaxID=106592 RepID=A0A9Q9DBW0_ENSAD|nr:MULTISPECIES: hypothetical protein [Ensifer]KSV70181.1 hypothetical protein N182_31665 [Sinorhizobium sp. GL2]OWZ91661.1 hypothetical protein B9J07_21665 [Sinorhizobium sp. LM21]MBD9496767.1 hypothetical protein [Ensifer sp. ENS01]MBD9640382.1 hypothetical protein [Ensifer sp. ENS07]USJ25432.1 hypothetical protein NE863_23305 [Ensifer adhaerens]